MQLNWQTIFTALGSQTILLAAVAWIIKTVVSNRLAQESEAFKIKLTADANSEIERLKNSLQMVALEHQVRFSKLHEHRGEVIADLYKLSLEATWKAQIFIYQHPSNPERYAEAMEKALELYRFFELHQLYLPPSACAILENFASKIRSIVIHTGVYWTQIEYPSPEMRRQQNETILAACKALEEDIPRLRNDLQTEFRSLLGVA